MWSLGEIVSMLNRRSANNDHQRRTALLAAHLLFFLNDLKTRPVNTNCSRICLCRDTPTNHASKRLRCFAYDRLELPRTSPSAISEINRSVYRNSRTFTFVVRYRKSYLRYSNILPVLFITVSNPSEDTCTDSSKGVTDIKLTTCSGNSVIVF